jgi:hypothetical protein
MALAVWLVFVAQLAFADEVLIQQAPDDRQVRPLKVLNEDRLLAAAQIGMGIVVTLNPEFAAIKKAADFTALVAGESVKAADFRNSVVNSHLLVVSAEAKRLEDIRKRDGNLKGEEAQAILADLRRGHFSDDSTASFLVKSVFSGRMVYGVASQYAVGEITGKIGEKIAKSSRIGNEVELLWVRKGSLMRRTGIQWSYLKAAGEQSRRLTNAFEEVVLKRIGRRIGRYTVESTLDKFADEVLREHPSIPEAATYLRLNVMIQPREAVAMAQAARPAEMQIALPVQLEVQQDPVASAASVQRQIIDQQQYQVSSGEEPSSHVERVDDHPTHSSNIPTSINISGASFTGASGSTLFSRF